MRPLLFSVVIFLSLNSFAQEFTPEEVPPLRPLRLFVSKLDPREHLLLAVDAKGGNHYLLNTDGNGLHIPKFKKSSMIYFDGGTADLYLESGERVLLPSTQSQNYLNTTMGPTIMSAYRAPIALKEIAVTPEDLGRLNLTRFLAPEQEKKVSEQEEPAWKTYEEFSAREPLLAIISLKEGTKYDQEREVEEKLKALSQDGARFLEREGRGSLFGGGLYVLLVNRDNIETIQRAVPKDLIESFSTLEPIDPAEKFVLRDLGNSALPLQDRLAMIKSLYSLENIDRLTDAQKIEIINDLVTTLGQLEKVYLRLSRFLSKETAIRDFKKDGYNWDYGMDTPLNLERTKNHPLYNSMLMPLRETAQQTYQILDRVNHPRAREFVIETASAFEGVGLPMLVQNPSGQNHSYYQEWLLFMRRRMASIDKLSAISHREDLGEKLRLSSHSGGFENIKVSLDFYSLRDYSDDALPLWPHDRMTESYPTILFGLPGDKDGIKRDFIQFIIDADKKAKAISDWNLNSEKAEGYRTSKRFSARGSEDLYNLLRSLPYAPPYASEAFGPKFSRDVYEETVMDIYRQLIEIASMSLTTSGTYLSVLDSALGFARDIERRYQNDRKSTKNREAAIQIERLVTNKLLNGLNWASFSEANADACAAILATDPWGAVTGNSR